MESGIGTYKTVNWTYTGVVITSKFAKGFARRVSSYFPSIYPDCTYSARVQKCILVVSTAKGKSSDSSILGKASLDLPGTQLPKIQNLI